jgi:hypothetical protein
VVPSTTGRRPPPGRKSRPHQKLSCVRKVNWLEENASAPSAPQRLNGATVMVRSRNRHRGIPEYTFIYLRP